MGRLAWGFLLLLSSSAVAAANDGTELQRLYGALNVLNQEQQAVYQQFQMVQELRRANAQALYVGPMGGPPLIGGVQDYAEVVEAQKNATRRGEDLAEQANQLYARYNDIEARKKPILQRIYELTLSP